MRKHIVIGAGGIGRGVAEALTARGDQVVLAARSVVSAPPEGVTPGQVDAADVDALADLAQGADTIINAVNPPSYATWARDWPPVAAALLAAAEKTGAGLVTISNLYGYGQVATPITEELPLAPTGAKGRIRAQMWHDALAAHEAGRVRVTELRASDYFGAQARARTSYLNSFVIRPALTRRTVRLVMGDPEAPHTWTYLPDIARLAAALACDDRSWGRPWHVPSPAPRSVRQVVGDVAALAGRPAAEVRVLPRAARTALRLVPTVRELDETAHQFQRPFVLDAGAAERTFGLVATPWEQALAQTVAALRRTAG